MVEELDPDWAHICVDMQRVFAEETEWHAPWLNRVLPAVEALSERGADRTIFTRFLSPETPEGARGAWREYYRQWTGMTRAALGEEMFGLVPSLARLVPPARVFDKPIYSPWLTGNLHGFLQGAGIKTLVISGGESDVCVLATVLGAIDLGYRIVLVSDAIFGSADQTHDASLAIYNSRFQFQLSVMTTEDVLDAWKAQGR
jgi:nicotinamidase-related amidase